jgi:hypothetical protein
MRRAATFLGLGLNAAYDEKFKDYSLSKITRIDLVTPDASEDEIAHIKEEFSFWIIGNGLRELIETYSVFLDGLYDACLFFKAVKSGLSKKHYLTAVEAFHYEGLDRKLVAPKKGFDIKSDTPEYLISTNKARNCLTHRRGIIGKPDTGTDAKFHLKWRGMEVKGHAL